MLKHIVFFNIAEHADGKTKSEHAQYVKTELENLIHLIPQIKKIEVGINHPEAPVSNFDIVLYSEFDNLNDLNIYQEHPEHKRVAAYIAKIKTGREAVDYMA